jgi:hypothetical protein
LLVALHQGPVRGARDLLRLREQFVPYPVELPPTGRLATTGRHDPLPVVVTGVNPRWTCAVWYANRLHLVEASTDRLHAVLEPNQPLGRYFLGNLLESDQPDVFLEWGGRCVDGVRLHAHNPTAGPLTCRIRTHPQADFVPALNASWTLAPGESVWLRGRGDRLTKDDGRP